MAHGSRILCMTSAIIMHIETESFFSQVFFISKKPLEITYKTSFTQINIKVTSSKILIQCAKQKDK